MIVHSKYQNHCGTTSTAGTSPAEFHPFDNIIFDVYLPNNGVELVGSLSKEKKVPVPFLKWFQAQLRKVVSLNAESHVEAEECLSSFNFFRTKSLLHELGFNGGSQ